MHDRKNPPTLPVAGQGALALWPCARALPSGLGKGQVSEGTTPFWLASIGNQKGSHNFGGPLYFFFPTVTEVARARRLSVKLTVVFRVPPVNVYRCWKGGCLLFDLSLASVHTFVSICIQSKRQWDSLAPSLYFASLYLSLSLSLSLFLSLDVHLSILFGLARFNLTPSCTVTGLAGGQPTVFPEARANPCYTGNM